MQNQISPQQMLTMAMQRCRDPKMRQIIQNNMNNPKQMLEELCSSYPNIASQIDTGIGNGQNPQQWVMSLLGRF